MPELSGLRVAIMATDGFEESELTEPLRALREAGAQVDVVAPHGGQIQGMKHADKASTVHVDRTLDEARPGEYDALELPGGALNADAMRMNPKAQAFVREFQSAGKPMAVICHAPWILVSAGLVKGRTLTSYHTIQDDIRNAGGEWVNEEVVVDGNWVTSRQPSDIPAFNKAMLQMFAHAPAGAGR